MSPGSFKMQCGMHFFILFFQFSFFNQSYHAYLDIESKLP